MDKKEEILKKHLEYGNPTSIQDWVDADGYVFREHILAAMEEYASSLTSSGGMKIRPVVAWFAEQMEMKLKANDHKNGWLHNTSFELEERLEDECDELKKAAGKLSPVKENVIGEAADVANFAMMIADLHGNKIGPESPSVETDNEKLEMKIVLGLCRVLLGSLLETRDDAILKNLKSFIQPTFERVKTITDQPTP